MEVICFTDVDTDERHELKLGEPLSCRGREREQVPKVSDLRVDQVATQFARPFRRLARIEAINCFSKNINQFDLKKSRNGMFWKTRSKRIPKGVDVINTVLGQQFVSERPTPRSLY